MSDTCGGEGEINTPDETDISSAKLISKTLCPSNTGKGSDGTSERKKVYRSIFGPDASSESDSDTYESSDSSDSEETVLQAQEKDSPTKDKMADKSTKDFISTPSKEHVEDMQLDQNTVVSKETDVDLAGAEDLQETANSSEHFLSPEEKDAVSHIVLSHIAEVLDKRNITDSKNTATRLYTGPYGRIHSPFKKFSSFHGFPSGVKRSPRKLAGPAAKRTKLFHEDEEDFGGWSSSEGSPTEDTTLGHTPVDIDRMSNEASGNDSTDEGKLAIVEDDQEFDKKLEDKSSKFSLSVVNVKSIIHKIVTNENVIEMVRKAVHEEMVEHDLRFEPKMTRSKLKEFEAQGQVPPNWGLSPRKKRESPNFLEMELPEDEEDDEDFNPDKVIQESDEDSESVLSSCLSDIGSPMPSTPTSLPTTPTVTSSPVASTPTDAAVADAADTSTLDENSSQSFLSPMGPPLQTSVPKSQHKSSSLGRKYQEAMEREKQIRDEEAELIASRTRSKYPLKDCSILDIEANFVAPDITQDMYEICDDYDWAEFLSTLIRFPDDDTLTNNLNTTNDEEDTEDDPEYNFQAEFENFEFDREDFRDDRAVKVTKKEVNELLDDILNDDNEDDTIDEQYKITIKTQSEKIVFSSNKQTKYQKSLISAIGEHERRQIDDQLRKHVQQLAQTYVMAQTGIAEHKPFGDTAKFYLNELNNFAEKSEILYGKTAFRVCSLEPALSLLDDQTGQNTEELSQPDKERLAGLVFKYDSQSLPAFSYKQMITMWTSPVFMFPELLPHGGFFKHVEIKRDRARVKFLEPEDNLLAMGVSQFSHVKKDAKDYIQRFMLPCKSRKQIEIRIKNLNAKASKDNSVKFYKKYRKLPRFPQHAPQFDISMMVSLQDGVHNWNELPLWCQFFCMEEKALLLNESVKDRWERQRENKRRRKERQSASFSLSDSDMLPMFTPPHPSSSAPVTPQQQTDSSLSGSSGCESALNLLPIKRKRPRRQSRKKLNMNKEKKSGIGVVGSFVPLSLPGTSIPQQSQQTPLTICVLDGTQGVTPVPSAVSPCIGTLPGNPMDTCATPTIVVINKNAALQVQSFNQTVTFTSPHTYPQTVSQNTLSPSLVSQSTQSSIIPTTVPAMNVDSTKSDSEIDGKSLTFEEICRPIMEAEMAADVMPTFDNKELCTLYTENGSEIRLNSVKNDAIVNIVDNVSCKSLSLSDTPVCSGSAGSENASNVQSARTLNLNVDLQSQNRIEDEVQSSEISSTVSKNQVEADLQNSVQELKFQDTATSPFPVEYNQGQEVTLQKEADTPTRELEMDTTLTDSLPAQCSCTPTQELNSPASFNSELTPKHTNSSSDLSSSEKTPKSSLEVVAALAPYFISPIHSNGSLQYESEKTPTKRQLPTLAPKSISPSQRTAPVSFSDLSPAKRKLKIKCSPRKKHLQQQVKTILPKGFIVSSYDTSPAKKAASNLVDRAKQRANHLKGFCKILPRLPSQAMENTSQGIMLGRASRRGTSKKVRSDTNENDNTKESGIGTQSEDYSDHVADDVNENNNNNAAGDDDDRCGDTESDYTQSEDGNETQGTDGEDGDTQGTDDGEGTQGTDGDSQDSQEEDNHIADLMAASTTMGFVPSRDDLYGRSRLGKKDRDRDLNLALLDPDIVEADPQRDLRDTLFAQAYIHKVKKAMKDDVDKLEQFLRIMYHFSQDDGSPVKLYMDLQELFASHPELIYDFAGFLQPDQAIECGCYKAYQEFIQARTFLRKLEIYFNKNPNQLQKVMRTFSRWYKKPGRKKSDLREQIEPMLKGQKLLLEEFSRFFPNERPSESLMDDFEEINLDVSGEIMDKDTSFEEIELLDMEEVYGTKRCTCVCHDDGDDTYRKRKKHCYKCCLTVIDGELVYKVNKSTIKKISVTYGPPVKLSSLQKKDQSEDGKQQPVSTESSSQEPVDASSTTSDTIEREPGNVDWFLDSETAEKENIEHFSESTRSEKDGQHRKNKLKSPQSKETFLQRISKLPRNKPQDKPARLSSVLKGKSASPSLQEGQSVEVVQDEESLQQAPPTEDMETEYSETEHKGKLETEKDKGLEKCDQLEQIKNETEATEIATAKVKKSKSTIELENGAAQWKETEEIEKSPDSKAEKDINVTVDETNLIKSQDMVAKNSDTADVNRSTNSIPSALSSDILATAFSSALNTEVSMDSSCFPFSLSGHSNKLSNEVIAKSEQEKMPQLPNKTSTSLMSPESAIRPTVVSSVADNSASVSAPVGQSSLHVSRDSSFQKVLSSENIAPVVSEIEKEKETEIQKVELEKTEADKKEDRIEISASKPVSKIDTALDVSKSPPFSPFSPFSPFAQEIQSITSLQSPLSAVQSPGITRSLSSSGKVRRITPIPVKGDEGKTDSQSSFQTAMENSPVLPDIPVSSPSENTQNTRGKSVDNVSTLSSNSAENSLGFSGKTEIASFAADSGSDSQKLEDSSQKSNSNNTDTSCSQTSVTSEPPYTRTVISKPDIFSENANVGFPKVNAAVVHLDTGHSRILSEDSLFQCLSKPPEFSETLPNVSNLTNILHALDGHSQGSKLHELSQEDMMQENRQTDRSNVHGVTAANDKTDRNAAKSDFDSMVQTKAVDRDKNGIQEVVEESDNQLINVVAESANDSLSVDSSDDSSENLKDSLYPQSVESVENLKRLKTGLFKISTLSDSDTSGLSVPSSSATNILDKNSMVPVVKQKVGHETDTMKETAKVEENADENVKEKESAEIVANVLKVNEISARKCVESGSDSMTDTEGQSKRKSRKMSRRELRRSLQVKETSSSRSEYADGKATNSADEEDASENDEFNSDVQIKRVRISENDTIVLCKSETENANDIVNNVKESGDKIETYCDRTEFEPPVQNVTESALASSDDKLGEIKTEEPELLDSTGMSDVQSISDSVSEASSRGHKKSKHKHKSDKDRSRKRKRRKEDKDSDSTTKSEKKKKKKSKRREGKEQSMCGEKINPLGHENIIIEEKDVVQQTICNTTDTAPAVTEKQGDSAETQDVSAEAQDDGSEVKGDSAEIQDANAEIQGDSAKVQGDSAEIQGASAVPNAEEQEDQMKEEPEWTKETDRSILETCKVHGIKEKTFSRIAKRIGHVTAKQVRKRFEHLFGMIFGHQYGEKTDK